MKMLYLLAFTALIACKKNNAPSPPAEPAEITDNVLADNLQFPWEIVWGPDDFIWMTERGGKISRVNPANGNIIPVFTIAEVKATGEGGLLGMALHPDFATTPHVFVAYNYDKAGTYTEKVVRFTYNGSTLTSPFTVIDDIAAGSIHNGCRLAITADLKLFITTGDAGNTSHSQNTNSKNGKILRVNPDGSIPADNPDPLSPVWTLGHRNAQGLVFANNRLYSSEHGPSNDDEINIIEKGRNYGWPTVQGFCDGGSEQSFCTTNNVKEPIKAWTPTIAPSGMDYYNSDSIPQWKNSLLLAILKDSRLVQLKLDNPGTAITETNEFFVNKYGRMRDVCISPNGTVYICTSNGGNSDKIIEVNKKQP